MNHLPSATVIITIAQNLHILVSFVREVKAICFTTKFTTQKAIGYNF